MHRVTISLSDIDLNNLEWLCETTRRGRSNLLALLVSQAVSMNMSVMKEDEKQVLYEHLTRKR